MISKKLTVLTATAAVAAAFPAAASASGGVCTTSAQKLAVAIGGCSQSSSQGNGVGSAQFATQSNQAVLQIGTRNYASNKNGCSRCERVGARRGSGSQRLGDLPSGAGGRRERSGSAVRKLDLHHLGD